MRSEIQTTKQINDFRSREDDFEDEEDYDPDIDDFNSLTDSDVSILAASDEDVFIAYVNGKVVKWTPATNTEVVILQLGNVKIGLFEDRRDTW
jgi:hypothetical protein